MTASQVVDKLMSEEHRDVLRESVVDFPRFRGHRL